MVALRYSNSSTSDNVRALCDIIRDPKCERVTLFGTVKEVSAPGEQPPNLPLMAATAVYSIPSVDQVQVVFDGQFLTAVRYPRYLDVRDVLDVAVAAGNVYFSGERAPLTEAMSPEDAAEALGNLGDLKLLDAGSRGSYFSLLSGMTEQQLVEVFK
ncbi:hypothetical protein QOT71_12045 [Pseudomonas aeruginosa]|uniref:hypothetical protein n=1 Tax=Pseudomonas aeruginosa TaxID=287 RepID=UPI001068230F|nr:hypothetical protein [Pseudomonas aeruginosa]TER18014.1 hypothetical protein IPC48_00565 [Pseudomonas aeruginosa]